jgi:hypothetical protein
MARLIRVLFECGTIDDYPDASSTIIMQILRRKGGGYEMVAQTFSRGAKDPYKDLVFPGGMVCTHDQLEGGLYEIYILPVGGDTWKFWHRMHFVYDNGATRVVATGQHHIGNRDGRPHAISWPIPASAYEGVGAKGALRYPQYNAEDEPAKSDQKPGKRSKPSRTIRPA